MKSNYIQTKYKIIVILILLYLLAIACRIPGCNFPAPLADELLWTDRSWAIVENINNGHYSTATAHLRHPGVPPALIMSATQVVFSFVNNKANLQIGDRFYCDKLCSARVGNILFSSLSIPVLFLLVLSSCSILVASVTALILCLDPLHVALSRMAHIDGGLTTLIIITITLYIWSLKLNRLDLKLFAAIFFGLAIATKPTALMILPALYFLKISYLHQSNNLKISNFFQLSDLLVLIIAQIVQVLICQRLWIHPSPYIVRFKIHAPLARYVYDLGIYLQQYYAVQIILIVNVVYLFLYVKSRFNKHIKNTLLILIIICNTLLLIALFPAQLENVIGFWQWTFGLHSYTEDMGKEWQSHTLAGYWTLYAIRFHEVVWLCILASLTCALLYLRKGYQKFPELFNLTFFAIIIVVVWTLPLNASTKQNFRYSAPILPFFSLLAGIVFAYSKQFKILASKNLNYSLALLVLLALFFNLVRLSPHYGLYFNYISGGLTNARNQHIQYFLEGTEHSIEKLKQATKDSPNDNILVLTSGSVNDIYNEQYKRTTPVGFRKLHFERFEKLDQKQLLNAEYLLEQGLFETQTVVKDLVKERQGLDPTWLYKYSFSNVDLIHLYKMLPYKISDRICFRPDQWHHTTGRLRYLNNQNSKAVVRAVPKNHDKGFVMAGLAVRLLPGKYRVYLRYRVLMENESTVPLPLDTAIMKLEFSKKCSRLITTKFQHDYSDVSVLECEFDRTVQPHIDAYWFGKVPVMLEEVCLDKNE